MEETGSLHGGIGKILRNFDFFLPKFHFILPKFYIPSPWKTKDLHRGVADFLSGD